jgi:thiol-disulfide isomerase/thioredoxin
MSVEDVGIYSNAQALRRVSSGAPKPSLAKVGSGLRQLPRANPFKPIGQHCKKCEDPDDPYSIKSHPMSTDVDVEYSSSTHVGKRESYTHTGVKSFGSVRELKRALETQDKPSAVLFYASWCGHCTKYQPVYDRISASGDLGDKMNFYKIEASDLHDADFRSLWNVNVVGFPTIYVFDNGTWSPIESGKGRESPKAFQDAYASTKRRHIGSRGYDMDEFPPPLRKKWVPPSSKTRRAFSDEEDDRDAMYVPRRGGGRSYAYSDESGSDSDEDWGR